MHKFEPIFWAENESGGRENSGDGAVRSNHRHRKATIVDGISIARIEDVPVTTALMAEMAQVITGGGDGMICGSDAGPAVTGIFGIVEADVPRALFGRFAVHSHILPEIDQHVFDPTLQGKRHDPVNGVFLANPAKIDAHPFARKKNRAGPSLNFAPTD